MANVIMGYPNLVNPTALYTPTILPGFGNFLPTLPAAHILDRYYGIHARTAGITEADTQFAIDLGVVRTIRLVAIPDSSVSTKGEVRVVASNDPAFGTLIYDGGWEDYWTDLWPYGTRPWGMPDILTSKKPSAEDVTRYPKQWFKILPSHVNARYWLFYFRDTENPDGFLDFSRAMITPVWEASVNPVYGDTAIGWVSRTRVRRGPSGAKYFNRKPGHRTASMAFDFLPQDEAFANPFEMGRMLDLDGEAFLVFDKDETIHLGRWSFHCNLTSLPEGRFTGPGLVSTTIEIEEIRG